MVWARAALAGGLLLLCLAFAFGTEHQVSASVNGQNYHCGAAIPASWFVTGAPDPRVVPGVGETTDQRRHADACNSEIKQSRVPVLTAMGAGGLIALVGWSGTLARPGAKPRQVSLVDA